MVYDVLKGQIFVASEQRTSLSTSAFCEKVQGGKGKGGYPAGKAMTEIKKSTHLGRNTAIVHPTRSKKPARLEFS